MKTQSILNRPFLTSAVLLSAIAFSSCEKNDVDESGMANLKVVNASQTSGEQNFYLANSVIISTGLGYTEVHGYVSTSSGNRLVGEFRNRDTNIEYAQGELWMQDGESYTVFLAGEGNDARVKLYEDKLSAPPANSARVKFIHLSDGAPSDIRIKDGSGSNLVNNLSRNIQSGYQNIPAGTLSLSIYSTGQGNLVGNFTLNDLTAGKNYTVYITGNSSNNIQLNKVEY